MSLILINIFYGGEIVHTPYGVDYSKNAKCTLVINDDTNVLELRSQIYGGLKLIPSKFNITINARINTAQDGTNNYSLYCVDNEQIWSVIKSLAPSIGQYRTLELIVEAEPVVSSVGSSSYSRRTETTSEPIIPVTTEEGNDEHEDEEFPETWHLDEEDDHTEDEGNDGYETPEEEFDEVQRILSEWRSSIPFINRGMKHLCPSFSKDSEGPYANEPYYRKPRMLDEEFGEGQIFETKKN